MQKLETSSVAVLKTDFDAHLSAGKKRTAWSWLQPDS